MTCKKLSEVLSDVEATIDSELTGVRDSDQGYSDKAVRAVSSTAKVKKRGRPKGARTTTLTAVRKQAAEEKKQLKRELDKKIHALQSELDSLRERYDQDIAQLNHELDIYRRREASYQLALSERLNEVADHLQTTLLSWGAAELEEAQIDKRGRGRPRKTLKPF